MDLTLPSDKPSMHEVHRQYDRHQAEDYERARAGERHWMLEDRYVAALFAEQPRCVRLLDAPVGTGRFFYYYAAVGEVIGIDASVDMLAMAERRSAALEMANVALREADLFALPFTDDSFDRTLCWRFLHLLPATLLAKAMGELARVTSGRIFVQAYVRGNALQRAWGRASRLPGRVLRLARGNARQEQPWSHIQAYFHDASALLQAFSDAGLKVVEKSDLCGYQGHRVQVFALEKTR
jgi:ubiquinone/menaquinone biosynthesis C-methylase UbiE